MHAVCVLAGVGGSMLRALVVALLVAVGAAVSLAGCGSSSTQTLTSAIHTKVKSSLIMRLSCGNTLKSIRGAAPFGCGAHQAFPQVIRSSQS